jgi:Ser/Thr protein kinase RdoA (MazF antagonist)
VDDGQVPVPDPAAILAAFAISGQVRGVAPVDGAWSNQVYRLTTTAGVFAVKLLRNPWANPRWQDWLAAAWEFELLAFRRGVAMPEPIPSAADDGPVAWVDDVPVRLHRWVDGTPLLSGPVAPDVADWAGRTLATLHSLAVTAADRSAFPGPALSTATADAWPELAVRAAGAPPHFRRHWADRVMAVWPAVQTIAELARVPADAAAEVMTHGDIDQKNIVLSAGGPVLCDWDVAMPMQPRRELADVAMSMAGFTSPPVARQVVRAYAATGMPVADLGPADLAQSLVASLDWVEFNISRAVGARPGTPAEVARSNELVPALLAALPAGVEAALRCREFLRT